MTDAAASHSRQITRPTSIPGRSAWRLVWAHLRRKRLYMASLGFILLLGLVAALAPVLTALIGHGPNVQYPNIGLDLFGHPTGPSRHFLLGTDSQGRDVLSRLIYGTRVSLEVGVGATALALVLGLLMGLPAGYYGGKLAAVLGRVMDVLLSFPVLLFALAARARFGPSLGLIVVVVGLFSSPYIGRLVRGQVLSLKEREFIEGAVISGAGDFRIMLVEILPNLIALAVVYATLLIPISVVIEATLSYLGLGVQPPTASWGNMIADAQSGDLFVSAWWVLLFPSLALFVTTLALNLLGNGLRDALDPHHGHGWLRIGGRR